MSKRNCKFFANGGCLKGEQCAFSHDLKSPPRNICNLYRKGTCTYGGRCKYQHVKVSESQASDASSSLERKWVPVEQRTGIAIASPDFAQAEAAEYSSSDRTVIPPTGPGQREMPGHHEVQETIDNVERKPSVGYADLPLCSFPTAGDCPSGVRCHNVHGAPCSTCGKNCLHSFRPKETEEHLEACEKRQKHLEAIRLSNDIECHVCLELVLSKPTPAERKFGILPECDHPFCISCIRNWRRVSSESRVDVNFAVRSCPTCRKVSYFVVPSDIWYSSDEEKQEIISSYKEKLRSIDCKHFKFGNGTCPFGHSCFYKHTVKPSSSFWNLSINPGAHNSRYSGRYQDNDEEENSHGMSAFALIPMVWEASQFPDLYDQFIENPGESGPLDNPDVQAIQLLAHHLYHRHSEEHDHDD